jgi:dolichol-phosphate mannosyltransferase
MKLVDIVVPVYNEQETIAELLQEVRRVFDLLPYSYVMTLVDDGSTDETLAVVKCFAARDARIKFISLSRNFGHQAALKAGLDKVHGDCVITMDGDMQHPPKKIPDLLYYWEEGYDVVYTIRKEAKARPGYFKRKTSDIFYRVMNRLADLDVEKGSADFRLMDKKVADELKNFKEHELFYRGLVKWMGFKQIGIEYEPAARHAGRTKYTVMKMIRFALQGITSFSTQPLYFAAYLGLTFSLSSLLYIPYAFISYYFGRAVNGWTSVVVIITFFGGLQLCILGIIGLYLGKVFMQGKNRPLYIIKEQ